MMLFSSVRIAILGYSYFGLVLTDYVFVWCLPEGFGRCSLFPGYVGEGSNLFGMRDLDNRGCLLKF